jgi:hypothetical protein
MTGGCCQMLAEATVLTENAPRQLAALCQALERRAQSRPARGISVRWTETDGTIDFGWARCTVNADATSLAFRAEAEDDDALALVCELITQHLEGHSETNAPAVTWLCQGKPITGTGTRTERRDRMRAFHRRMRRT